MNKAMVLLIFLVISLNSYAQIGVSQTDFNDQSRERLISAFVFYPTNETPTKTFAENIAFQGLSGAENAEPLQGEFPLYIMAHGTSGNWKNLTWLVKSLAESAVVVSANYPGYTSGEATPESVIKPWDQAKDVSFLIDAVLASPFGGSIDRKKVVVIGSSLGGCSALAVAGAIIDLTKYQVFCKTHIDKSCSYFEEALESLSVATINEGKQSVYDSRVSAAIALAPGFTESMTLESLESSSTPMLIISAENDRNVPLKTPLPNIPKNIDHYQISEASHFREHAIKSL